MLCVAREATRERVAEVLRARDLEVLTAERSAAGLDRIRDGGVDCVVSANRLPDGDGLGFLRAVRDVAPGLPFVLFPADGDEELAAEAVAADVTEYVPRDGEGAFGRVADRVVAAVEPAPDRQRESAGSAASALGSGASSNPDPEGSPVPGSGETRGSPDVRPTSVPTASTTRTDGGRYRPAIEGEVPASVSEIDGDVSEELKERAMDEAPVGITIADTRLPDDPLIYINDAFERLTGYSVEETLGRNCRLLQGEESDPKAIAEMRSAIQEGRQTSVELINYRKDGEMFWNRVDIAPIEGADGEATYFVGFQTDITQRKRAELAAERRAAQVDRERRRLDHLLDRINGLLQDVTGALVQSVSRGEIEREVCRRVVDTEPYEFAWIGIRDLAAGAVVPNSWSEGGEAYLDGFAVDLDDADVDEDAAVDDEADVDAENPIARALRTGEVQTVECDSGVSLHGDCVERAGEFASMAAVPLVYRDSEYGVLCVYSPQPDAFDEREEVVLGALGRAIATAISAREGHRMLATDEVVELDFELRSPDLFFVAISEALDCRFEYAGSVSRSEGSIALLFSVEGATPEEIESFAVDHVEVDEAVHITGDDDQSLFEFHLPDAPLVEVLAERGVETRSITAEGGTARLGVVLPRQGDARELVERLKAQYAGTELLAYRERERAPTTKQEFVTGLEESLTDRQWTALQKAYASGYFDWPRTTSGDELAESMGVSRSTFHQHLRAAERKLVEALYDR